MTNTTEDANALRREGEMEMSDETVVWLIEFGTSPTYWQGWHTRVSMNPNAALFWTSKAHEAVWFVRREDASRVIAMLGLSGAPVEHMFIGESATHAASIAAGKE